MNLPVGVPKNCKEFEISDENEVLEMTWNKVRSNIGEAAFREGALSGKDLAFQNGFNSGYSLGYEYGYYFGYVKGLTSILEDKDKLGCHDPMLGTSSKAACCMCSKENTDVNSYSEVVKLQKQTSSSALNDVKNKYSSMFKEYQLE